MNILGIRVEPKKTTFSVISIENENYKIINIELIKIPAALDFPEKLKYIRNCVLDISVFFKVVGTVYPNFIKLHLCVHSLYFLSPDSMILVLPVGNP
jgi:hypothetical protein